MDGRPNIEGTFKDHPVLDILHIAYEDFVQSRLTKIEKLNRIMFNTYKNKGYERAYLKKLINIMVRSEWFGKSNNPNIQEVHLLERGVEVYLNMVQNYRAEKRAVEAKRLTIGILIIASLTLVAAVVTIMKM